MLTTITHDPFGRFEVLRRTLKKDETAFCAWCGKKARFEYGIQKDGIYTKPEMDGLAFCSIGCRRIYFI